jgi:enoyl-CoA hydratase/carnithine racemase
MLSRNKLLFTSLRRLYMAIVEWKKDGTVAILTMNNGENRHNPDWTEAMLKAFDEMMADEEVKSLVITSSDPKSWNLGVDLAWMGPMMEKNDIEGISKWLIRNNDVFRFVLMAPFPTIAAITGHAFGNGAMLACACDFRFMRKDRGFMCFPEVDIHIQFSPSMIEWVRKAMPYHFFLDMKWSGRRVGAEELAQHNIIRKACDGPEETLQEAIAYAKTFNKPRQTLKEMKIRTYKHITDKMDNEDLKYLKPPVFMFTP